MNPAGTGAFLSDVGQGTSAFLWRLCRKEASVFAILVVPGFAVRFAASPGVTPVPFGVDPGLRNPNMPFVSPTQFLLGAAALTSGFVFLRGYYLWESRWAPVFPSRRGCPSA